MHRAGNLTRGARPGAAVRLPSGGLPAMHDAQPSDRGFALGVVAIVGVALGLGGWFLTREPLWDDELDSLALAGRPFGELLGTLPEEHNGALFHLALWPIVHAGRTGSAWLRLLALIAFAAAVALCALVGARLAGRAAGLVAAGLLALNPFAVAFAHEARMYAFALCLSLLAAWALLRALERPSATRWAAYTLSLAAAGYAHDFALLTAAAHPFLVWGVRRSGAWRGYVAALGGALVLLLPLALLAASDWGSNPLYWVSRPAFERPGTPQRR